MEFHDQFHRDHLKGPHFGQLRDITMLWCRKYLPRLFFPSDDQTLVHGTVTTMSYTLSFVVKQLIHERWLSLNDSFTCTMSCPQKPCHNQLPAVHDHLIAQE